MREGNGVYTFPDGSTAIGAYTHDREIGEGVHFNADRSQAWRSLDGVRKEPITLDRAASILRQIGAQSVERYNPATGAWEAVASMGANREDGSIQRT